MSRYIEASLALEQAIYGKVKRIMMIRYAVFIVSFISLCSAGVLVWNEVAEYTSLFFIGDAAIFWREIVLSILDAIPFLSTLALFISLTLMLWSMTNIYVYKKRFV